MSNYSANVIEVTIPHEVYKAQDYKVIAEKVNEQVRKHFGGKKVVVHPISGEEHPGKNIEDVLKHLLEHGTEKPEEKSKEQGAQEKQYDFLGTYHEVNESSDIMGAYTNNQMKVNLIAVYSAEHVEKSLYSGKTNGIGDAYSIKNKDNKREALKGVLKIVPEKKAEEKQKQGNEEKQKQGSEQKPTEAPISDEEIEQILGQLQGQYQAAK